MRRQSDSEDSGEDEPGRRSQGYVEYFSTRMKGKEKFNPSKKQKDYYYSHPEFIDYLSTIKQPENHFENYKELTQEILMFVESGHNVCVYGKGSKYQYLESLAAAIDRPHVCKIKGFSSALNEKTIINKLGDFLHSYGIMSLKQRLDPLKQLQKYREALENTDESNKILILIHNLDGQNIYQYSAQHILSYLGTLPRVRLICSIDSIRTPMHWSPQTLSNFGFIFYHLATQKPYKLQFSCLLRANQRKQRLEQSLKLIIKGLNHMQKQILKIIARRALKNLSENTNQIHSYAELLEQCIQEAILGTDYQLRENLIQLTDHKVLELAVHQNKKKGYILTYLEKRFLEFIIEDTDNNS